MPRADKCYGHHPEPVTQSGEDNILCKFIVLIGRPRKATRPDIGIDDYKKMPSHRYQCHHLKSVKEYNKISNYNDLEIGNEKKKCDTLKRGYTYNNWSTESIYLLA